MRTLVRNHEMHKAGTILVEQLGEFLDYDEEEIQILLDGPDNPFYYETLSNLNPYTLDDRIIVVTDDEIRITEYENEFLYWKKRY